MLLKIPGSAVAIAVVAASAVLSAQVRPFVVAAYSDGGLVPFARFTGTRWVNTWPTPDESDVRVPPLAEVPTTWLGKPVPRQWTFWPASGNRRSVTVVGTRRGDGTGGGCTQPAVLTMDQTLGSESQGLAIATDQLIEAVRRVQPSTPEWRHLEPVIDAAVRTNERRLVASKPFNRAWQQEALAEVDVFQAPLTIETVYRPVADASPVLYYFEAVRSANRRNGSSLTMKVSGWVRPEANGGLAAFALFGNVFDDEATWTVTPLAIVRIAERVFWITGVGGYESYSFVIRDVSPTAIRDVLTSDNGGC
jgi:hypothetical protein